MTQAPRRDTIAVGGALMKSKSMISLSTGSEDAEKGTASFLVAGRVAKEHSLPGLPATGRPDAQTGDDVSLGERLAHAVAAKNEAALQALLSTPVRFRGVTPRRFWDAETAPGVVDIVLGTWFGPDKSISGILSIETDLVADVQKVSYRLAVDLESGPSEIEQVAYFSQQQGKITDLRIICSGFRPVVQNRDARRTSLRFDDGFAHR
jgi:hypothetical protein